MEINGHNKIMVDFYDLGTINENTLGFVVICASYNSHWIYGQHSDRTTWEIPGGHRETRESAEKAAKRELYEETGSLKYEMNAICDYSVENEQGKNFGRIFLARIDELGKLPDYEIERIALFDTLPENLTYPEIQPLIFKRVASAMARK
jgi:8-oxo-dGTP diphosphatase